MRFRHHFAILISKVYTCIPVSTVGNATNKLAKYFFKLLESRDCRLFPADADETCLLLNQCCPFMGIQ